MSDREKLIELIEWYFSGCNTSSLNIADHLLANGVCFAERKVVIPIRSNETKVRAEGVIGRNNTFWLTKEQAWGMTESMRQRLRKKIMDELVKNGSLKEILYEENGEVKMRLEISVKTVNCPTD